MRLIVKDVAEREGIRNANELSRKTGIPLFSMYRIWDGRAKMVALDTLDRLCTVLNVKPGQLFEHEAEPDKLPRPDSEQADSSPEKPAKPKTASKARKAKAAPARTALAMG